MAESFELEEAMVDASLFRVGAEDIDASDCRRCCPPSLYSALSAESRMMLVGRHQVPARRACSSGLKCSSRTFDGSERNHSASALVTK